jgi:MSHA biogenesis protein MshJ
MSNYNARLQHYIGILNHRSLRERVYIFLTLIVLLIVAWDQLLLEPAIVARKKVKTDIARLNTEIAQLHAEETIVMQKATLDPDLELRKMIAQLDQALNVLNQQLTEKFVNLLSPREMPQLLKNLLKEQKSLKLIKMENLPPEPMMSTGGDGKATSLGIYIHALTMELEGNYLKLLTYLESLEQMEQRVFWDILTIDAKGSSPPQIRLQIHTLSLSEDWIGV